MRAAGSTIDALHRTALDEATNVNPSVVRPDTSKRRQLARHSDNNVPASPPRASLPYPHL